MTEPLFAIEGLAGGYGDVQVLWHVDLAVREGQIVALIGSNGAGKTTLLRIISGLIPPWQGKVTLRGTPITGLDAPAMVSEGVVHVPEGRRLFRGLSVYDNLLLGAYRRREGGAAVKADLDRVFDLFPRLAERRSQDATTLSGGEQQMCAIARGLMAKPQLLLIDELSLGLAPKVVDELVEALRRINAEGTSLLIVEQDVMTALDLADHAYVLDQGRSTTHGPTAEIINEPGIRTAYLGI